MSKFLHLVFLPPFHGVKNSFVNPCIVTASIIDTSFHAVGYIGEYDLIFGVEYHLLASKARMTNEVARLKKFTLKSK